MCGYENGAPFLYPAGAQRLSLRLAIELIRGRLSPIFVSKAGARVGFNSRSDRLSRVLQPFPR
jgi:hypothetical protein